MMRILRDKLVRLGKDEDGAALIVTLALFMFMYLSCAGVFAVGQQVKNRIHLQNACDAAAYSAAVVQADTLSRIATINRAMAWTYVSMTRRQMDVVTYRWLGETVAHWECDRDWAIDWANSNIHPTPAVCDEQDLHRENDHSWHNGEPAIRLYGASVDVLKSKSEIEGANDDFKYNYVGGDASFYSRSGSGVDNMVSQIHDDRENIKLMGEKIDELKDDYKGRAEVAATLVLDANLSCMSGRSISEDIFFLLSIADMNDYAEVLPNGEEGRFLSYIGENIESAFGKSGIVWFILCDFPDSGFRRGYNWNEDRLKSEWEWYSIQHHCYVDEHGSHHINWPCEKCVHGNGCFHGAHARCHCENVGFGSFRATVYGDNERSVSGYKDIYETPAVYTAYPNRLTEDYFGAAGTITVGLACYNENPWYRILRNSAEITKGILGGIYGAFNPYKHVEWTWAFSSTKAGYKFVNGDADYNEGDDKIDSRSYVVDWRDGNWNLCQSDWDAVFVPVRRAVSKAADGSWSDGESAPLKEWIEKGDWKPLDSSGSSPTYAVTSTSLPNLPGMHDSSGSIHNIDWDSLADMLYH